MKNFICPVCGNEYIGDAAPERCPVCKVPGYKLSEVKDESGTSDATVHHTSVGKGESVSKGIEEEQHHNTEKYYYVNSKHAQAGPVFPTNFVKLGISKSTLVWRQGMAEWQPAGELPELLSFFRQTQQPPKITPPSINPQQKSNNYMLWAILSALFCCLATGATATYYAYKGETLEREGKMQDSIEAMKNASKWTFISLGIGVLGYIFFAVFGPSGYLFFQILLLVLWLTKGFIEGIGTGASPNVVKLLWLGGFIFLCWIIPILYNLCLE